MGEAQPSVVNITVRCAFQTGQDIRVESPLTWTIKNLKEHLHDACSLHPAVTSQRLIYAGACLTDDMTISSIVARRTFEGEPVFHLVCPLPQSSPELRRRENRPQAAPTNGNTNPQAFNNPWQGAFFGVPAGSAAAPMQSGNQAQAYQAYYAWYMNNYAHMMSYYQNMAMATGSAAAAATGNPVGAAGFGFPMFPPNGMNGFAPQAQINDQLQQQQPVGNVQQVQEDADAGIRMAGVGGGGDILDIAYSLFRIALFLSVVLLYASFERFLIVFAIGLFIFFIQLRRGQRRAADAANPPPVPVNNNNNGENGGGGNAPQPQDIGMEQTGIQIFFSTCYSFITSFFTSLVPENPVPVNLN